MNNLTAKHCIPCEGGVDPLTPDQIAEYKKQLKQEWFVKNGTKLHRVFSFDTFMQSIDFINKIAQIAEEEQHHPDMYIFFNKVQIELFTHAIGGLHENDFILAAKIEELVNENK